MTPMAPKHHPSTLALLEHFQFEHLPVDLQLIAMSFHSLAHEMASGLPSDAEVTAGLRKLLEAKDCFVRAAARKKRHPGGGPSGAPMKATGTSMVAATANG